MGGWAELAVPVRNRVQTSKLELVCPSARMVARSRVSNAEADIDVGLTERGWMESNPFGKGVYRAEIRSVKQLK